MSKVENVSFKCKSCSGVMTLGVDGGRKALTGPPPSCLYCGHTELEDTDDHLSGQHTIGCTGDPYHCHNMCSCECHYE